jgi:hypothetical protein
VKAIFCGFTVFFACVALFCFLGWADGFNFDHRDDATGFACLMGSMFAIGAGFAAYGCVTEGEEAKK